MTVYDLIQHLSKYDADEDVDFIVLKDVEDGQEEIELELFSILMVRQNGRRRVEIELEYK